MRFFSLYFLSLFLFSCKNDGEKKYEHAIGGHELLSLIKNGSLADINALAKNSGFICADTTETSDLLIYRYRDTLANESELSCHVEKGQDVIYIRFETKDQTGFKNIRQYFMNSGFVVVKEDRDIQQLGKPNSRVEIILSTTDIGGDINFNVHLAIRPANYPVN